MSETTTTADAAIMPRKSRSRGWLPSLWHRLWLTGLGIIALLVVIGAIGVVHFYSTKPIVTFDLIAEYDEKSRAIPQEDRAWTFYRRGLVTIDRSELRALPVDGRKINIHEALIEGPTHPEWPPAREYLSQQEEAVRLFTKGAARAELGFINRDPENEVWTQWDAGLGWEAYNPPGTGGPMILLAQLGNLRIVFAFLQGTMHAAIEDGEGPRAVEMALSLLRLADHARQTHDGQVADQIAFYDFSQTTRQIQRLVRDHSDLLTTSDLSRLSDGVRAALGGGRISYRLDAELRMRQDFLQRIYSDDGNGNGQITPAGLARMARIDDEYSGYRYLKGHLPYVPSNEEAGIIDRISVTLSRPVVAGMIDDRHTMEQKLKQLHALRVEMLTDVDTPPADSRYVKEVLRMTDEEPLRYLPLTVFVDAGWKSRHGGNAARRLVSLNLQRDAALLTIALERYRRQTGDWPDALTELVPELLPSVPVDLFAEEETRPLVYRLVDGAPLVYSVGPDHADDGGQFPYDDPNDWKAESADWRLIPPEEKQD